ncbi:5-(carboxyamino)imidazole ribonucleotide synthase [Desulfomicrobium baculatum]|uniref:N5-carboxyaminoimidazole ribonucleotide synthase n=1 Tax=Desulfomicrobium baculatum (strain DSM 4028 / VKM B-1378 / X) TaxID=525897 RepID=C7LWU8_DESBD|nr:5-(carboxyamino)imidazole ribonucleotide synthase [Desulfomicrobium baculatum]ACU91158.1 phosphoribosylaminoimidazole carboxylase, ATPase subunit [Desulfomicrobium baculatum DSM 4028]
MIIGVLGGGQLARMLAMAGLPLGFDFVFYDPAPDPCAAPLGKHMRGEYSDRIMLSRFAQRVDLVTYEFENVPAECIEFLSQITPVHPGAQALACAGDRLREKSVFQELGIPAPAFRAVDSLPELNAAIGEIGLPAVLKTRTLGYDGKGQFILRSRDDVGRAWVMLGGFSLVLESLVAFDREISVLGVRSQAGEILYYPLSENVHHEGVLRFSKSSPQDPEQKAAEELAGKLLRHLDYVGVLALELFQVGSTLLANEIAPRVHNSGHWTIEGAMTSQFENHLRAITGLPLGKTSVTGHSAVVNFIGRQPDLVALLGLRGLHVHLYGKAERPGRKVGHATLWSRSGASFKEGCRTLLSLL